MLCFSLKTFTPCKGQPYAYNYGAFAAQFDLLLVPDGLRRHEALHPARRLHQQARLLRHGDERGVLRDRGRSPSPARPRRRSRSSTPRESPIGICLHITGTPCFTPKGASSPTPAALPAAIGSGYQYDGQPVVIGARVYVPSNATNAVDCFDFATNKSCPNFPHVFSNLSLLYTVNRDPFRSSCLWVNADNGVRSDPELRRVLGRPVR